MFGESSLSGISDDEELNDLCRRTNIAEHDDREYQSAMSDEGNEFEAHLDVPHAGKGVLEASMAEIDADMAELEAQIGARKTTKEAGSDGPPPPLLFTGLPRDVSEDGPPPLNLGVPTKLNDPTINDTLKSKFIEMGSEWIRFFHDNQKKTLAECRRKLSAKFNADRETFRTKLVQEICVKMEKERAEYDAQLSKQTADLVAKFKDDHAKTVVDAKKHQWCKVCFNEAIYACCWNTSYCSVECQGRHWPMHIRTCRRKKEQ